MSDRLIITIDGPAGTGKSSVARALAHRLGLDFLDTGAMYRAAAAIVIDSGIDVNDHARLLSEVERRDLHFDFDTDPPTLLCQGESIMHRLRDPDVTKLVSPIATIDALRQEMVRKQRQIGMQHPRLVTEGRDQGSVVFPDADAKFFLHASPKVRAERRASQLHASGRHACVDELEREITSRDQTDSTRAIGPLTCPVDAESIDTSELPFDRVVEVLEAHVKRLLGKREQARLAQSPGAAPMANAMSSGGHAGHASASLSASASGTHSASTTSPPSRHRAPVIVGKHVASPRGSAGMPIQARHEGHAD